jgi:hypothetical protein
MGNQRFTRLAATVGLAALTVLTATAPHLGMSTSAGSDVQAKGTPTGNATASIAPTMQMGQTLGHQVPAATTTTVPAQ